MVASPSTRSLESIPSPEVLLATLRAISVLDVILCDRWEFRYYQCDALWGDGDVMVRIDNGSGDHCIALFGEAGVFVKGFDHESPMSPHAQDEIEVWPGIVDEVPVVLHSALHEPAFETEDVTFCIWRCANDSSWQCGNNIVYPDHARNDPDGSLWLLASFAWTPNDYVDWAKEYYEVETPLEVVQSVFAGEPLTAQMISSLNPERVVADALAEASATGYTVANPSSPTISGGSS